MPSHSTNFRPALMKRSLKILCVLVQVIDRNRIDREVLLAHVTGMNRVLFTWPWMYDGGMHYYPSIWFSSNIIEDNFKLRLVMRNITNRRTGKYERKCILLLRINLSEKNMGILRFPKICNCFNTYGYFFKNLQFSLDLGVFR